jgi:hypothetical protein
MELGFLGFGLTMILRPDSVRANFDRVAEYSDENWHPYKLPDWGLRVAGAVIIGIAAIFFQIAFVAFRH